jgi:valyl-tRNA synthetase
LLSLLAQKRRDETIAIADGPELHVDELFGTIKSAITTAALEAKAEQTDQEAVDEPLNRIKKALRETQFATAALPRAKTYEEFDQAEVTAQVEALKAALTQLEAALAEG